MDEHYPLLTAIVTSTHDGALPHHFSFMGPNLELSLQSHPVESSQSQSKDSLVHIISIEYQGTVQVGARLCLVVSGCAPPLYVLN